jgi:hypothetical protein
VGGLQCRLHDAGQVIADAIQVGRVLKPGRERGHGGHRLLHNAVLLIYVGVAVLVLSVIAIGVAVTGSSGATGAPLWLWFWPGP